MKIDPSGQREPDIWTGDIDRNGNKKGSADYRKPPRPMSIGDLREEYYNPSAYHERTEAISNAINNGATPEQAYAIVIQKDPLAGANWYYDPQGGGFGDRSMYNLPAGATRYHAGLDLYTVGQRIGTPLFSSWYGTVLNCERYDNEYGSRGNYVLIKLDEAYYGEDIYILLQHMGTFKGDIGVTAGERVAPGDFLGTVGNTGVGPRTGHLHIEVMVGGITIDPTNPTSSNNFSIDPVNDPRAQAILKSYLSAY